MRPGAFATIDLPRLVTMTTTLLAAACSLQASDPLETTSIECTTNDDGETTCSEGDDKPDGDDPGDSADLVCSGTGCVSECQYNDEGFNCNITCENGLSCQSSCKEGSCEISCDCPDDGGGGGCEGQGDECCQEHPDDPACHPGCEDGSTDEECNPPTPCPDGSTDEECNHCRENPDDPACQPDCEDGSEDCPPTPCPDGSTDEECAFCREHPEAPECQN
jgi:hypothetical protein